MKSIEVINFSGELEKRMVMKMETEEERRRFGVANFESRKHPRFSINLPMEYYQSDSTLSHKGRTINASEGGLLIYSPERLEIGQQLKLKLFFCFDAEMDSMEASVQVIWIDTPLGEEEYYRSGVKFVEFAPEGMERLRNFLKNLSTLRNSPVKEEKFLSLKSIISISNLISDF